MSDLYVSEIFRSLQGEGPEIGSPCTFVRLAGCDNHCVWCDTKYAGKIESGHLMTDTEVLQEIACLRNRHVILTGGNPALQDARALVQALNEQRYHVSVETQGTIWRSWMLEASHVNISPKPPSSECPTLWGSLDEFMYQSHLSRCLKVTIDPSNPEDCQYVMELSNRYPSELLVLQPLNIVGVDTTESLLVSLRALAEFVFTSPTLMQRHVRVLPQLHVWLWGNKRGV